MTKVIFTFHAVRVLFVVIAKIQFVLFGFLRNLASHLERFFSNHNYGYASSKNHPTCFASFPRNSEPFMNYPG